MYVLVVILSTEDDNRLLEQLKAWFKTAIKCNKHKLEISKQTIDSNLN